MGVSIVSAPGSFAATPLTSPNSVSSSNFSGKGLDPNLQSEADEFEKGLDIIMSIPDEVLLKGDDATKNWLRQNSLLRTPDRTDIVPYANKLACTGAIVALVGGNLVAAGKLLKIKKYIHSLGGVKEAVQVMWGASFSYEKMIAAGGALGALAAELTGYAGVKAACFQ